MPTYQVWDCSDPECDSYTLLQAGDADIEEKKKCTEAKKHLYSFDAPDWDSAKIKYEAFLEGYRLGWDASRVGVEMVFNEEVVAKSKEDARLVFGERYPLATILSISGGYRYGPEKFLFGVRAAGKAEEAK